VEKTTSSQKKPERGGCSLSGGFGAGKNKKTNTEVTKNHHGWARALEQRYREELPGVDGKDRGKR